MTYEELNEAIRYLEEEKLVSEATLYGENQDKYDNTIMLIDDAKFRESRKPLTIYDRAIMALEQQPCEDCVSRQVVKEMLTETWTKYMPMELDINLSFVLDKISALPSVTPSYNSVKTELISSEDCISREKAVYVASGYCAPQNIADELRRLPSVTPTRPHGEWIHFTDDFKDYAACSCCGYGEEGEVLLEDKTPFCPVCGADMREVEDEDSD